MIPLNMHVIYCWLLTLLVLVSPLEGAVLTDRSPGLLVPIIWSVLYLVTPWILSCCPYVTAGINTSNGQTMALTHWLFKQEISPMPECPCGIMETCQCCVRISTVCSFCLEGMSICPAIWWQEINGAIVDTLCSCSDFGQDISELCNCNCDIRIITDV